MNIPGAFTLEDVLFRRVPEEPALLLEQRAGYQVALLGPQTFSAASPTGLANDATVYTMTVTTDVGPEAVSIVGSAAQTLGALITELNTDLAPSGVAALLIPEGIKFSSLTLGPTSSVSVVDTGLLANLSLFQGLQPAVPGEDLYLRWNNMSVRERTDVAAVATAFDPSQTEWVHANDGFRVTGAGVVPGSATLLAAGPYDLNVNVDGAGAVNVTFTMPAGKTFQQLVDDYLHPAVVAQVGAGVRVFLSQASATELDILVETPTPGTGGSVAVTAGTSNDLIAALDATSWAAAVVGGTVGVDGTSALVFPVTGAGFQVVDVGGAITGASATGLTNDATVYTASITVDGTAYPIAVTGSTAQTYTTLLSEINTDLGAAATASLVGGNVRVTSATTGTSSSVSIADTNLFSTLTDYVAILPAVAGSNLNGTADNWAELLSGIRGLTGEFVFNAIGTKAFIEKGPKPVAKGEALLTFVYWDGTNWVYFLNDATLGAAVNPPEL